MSTSLAKLFVQVFSLRRRRDPDVEIGQTDELLQIWPAQQRALEEIEMPRRVGVRRQSMQQRRQQRVGIRDKRAPTICILSE